MTHHENAGRFYRRANAAFVVFLVTIGLLLFTEHRAHVLGFLAILRAGFFLGLATGATIVTWAPIQRRSRRSPVTASGRYTKERPFSLATGSS